MKNIFGTCIVRPFWFMIDEMNREINERTQNLFGLKERAEHLKYFRRSDNVKEAKRVLILTSTDILDILLTAYVDLLLGNIIKRRTWKLNDIPEIGWFQKSVNFKRGIQQQYVFDSGNSELLKKVGDRVVVEENEKSYFLKFTFRNGEYSPIGSLQLGFDVENEICNWIKNLAKPKAYQKFTDLLSSELSNEMENEIKEKFHSTFTNMQKELCKEYIYSLRSIHKSEKNFLIKAMEVLASEDVSKLFSNNKSLDEFYVYMQHKFRLKGCLPIALIFDRNDEIFPIKIASWIDNWNSLKR